MGVIKNNRIALASLILVFGIILAISFVLASHVITTSSGGTSYSVNEDVGFIYNITVNNTDTTAPANISQVNITIPNTLSFLSSSNGTDAGTHTFTNTSTVLSWDNDGLVMNLTWKYFWFNATASTPGSYNLTVTTTNTTGSYSSNISVTINDTTDPSSIEFVSPTESDNSNLSRSNLAVNVTATDNGVIDTIIIRLFNSTNNQINSSSSSTSPLFINFTGLSDGVYSFNATINDTYGNSNSTSTRTVTLDTTNPLVSYGTGTEVNAYNISRTWVYINISVTETNEDTITFLLYNSTAQVNSTSYTDGTRTINWTSLPDEVYTYNITVNDSAGNSNTTSTRTITLDNTYPLISFGTGTAVDNANLSQSNTYLNVSVTEANEVNITFNLYNSTNSNINSTTYTDATRTINWTGLSDGNYTYNVTITDSVNQQNSTSTRTITLDTGAPAVSFNNPSSYGNYSGSIVLNVTVTDGSGVDTVFFNITNSSGVQNATYTASNPSGNIWNATLNTSSFLDGIYNITAYANDSNGNLNNTVLVSNVTFDNTNPTVSHSCSPTSVTAGNTITCSCSGTDATSGVATTSYTANPSTSSTGTFSTGCTVTDYAGNSASSSISYTVTSSGGGGGGSSTTKPKQKVHSWTKITPGAATIMKNFDKAIGIKEIQIEVNNPAQNVKITVIKYDAKPAEVTKEKTGSVHKYLKIDAKNLENKLKKGVVTIQVQKSWVLNNSLVKEDIAMFKFNNNSENWDELTTTYKEEDTDYYYYDIELTSFSYFAISEKVKVGEPSSEQEGEDAQKSEEEISGGIPGKEKNLTWLWVVIGIIIVLVLTGAGYKIKKRKEE